MIKENRDSYIDASTQKEKKETCDRVIRMVRGRFLRFNPERNCWTEMDEESKRTKVAQAFQYRQRLIAQNEDPDEKKLTFLENNRKRRSSDGSFQPDHIGAAPQQNLRVPQPLQVNHNAVTLDEIRWVLGVQSSLPQQPSHQQSHQYWQRQQRQQIQQQQQIHHQSGSRPLPWPGTHLDDIDDYAIGIPASMRTSPKEQVRQLVQQPRNDMSGYFEMTRHGATSPSSADHYFNETVSLQMPLSFQQQAILMNEPERMQTASSAQQNLNWTQNQSDGNVVSSYVPNPVDVWPSRSAHASQSMDPSLMQQSIHEQGVINPGNAKMHVDDVAAFLSNTSSFDYPSFMAPSGDFQQHAGSVCNVSNEDTQRQTSPLSVERSYNLALQQELLIDPLPLDENETAPSQAKVMDRMDQSKKNKP